MSTVEKKIQELASYNEDLAIFCLSVREWRVDLGNRSCVMLGETIGEISVEAETLEEALDKALREKNKSKS